MIDFPASPTDGQVFSAPNGIVYTYSVANSAWLTSVVPGGVAGGVLSGTYPNPGHVAGIGAPLQLYSEQVLGATTNAFQINYPATARLVEIWWDVALAANNSVFMKAVQNGVPNTGASSYNIGQVVWFNPSTFTAAQGTYAYISLVGTGTQSWGVMRLTNPGTFKGVANHSAQDAANVCYQYQTTNFANPLTGCNGVQLTTGGTFAIGSYLRCLVLP